MSPVFAHGQLRLYLLALLADGPRHGYELIQDLERRFGGLYSPSAGTIYPRLAKLEQEGLVVRTDEDRRSTYRLTDAGRAEVLARQGDLDDLEADIDVSARALADRVRASVSADAKDLRAELKAAAQAARAAAVPAGSTVAYRQHGRSPGRGAAEIETAVAQLREEARTAWRRHGLTEQQVRDIADIVVEATRRIGEVVSRPR